MEQTVAILVGKGASRQREHVQIPSHSDLLKAADDLRLEGGSEVAAGRYGRCIGIYYPPLPYRATSKMMDFDGGNAEETISEGLTSACCSFWYGTLLKVALAWYSEHGTQIQYLCSLILDTQLSLFGESVMPRIEGQAKELERNIYERDLRLRKACIDVHGTACKICGINFESIYGLIARDFVHVHHLTPLSAVGVAHTVDPATDLIPVCPNCHAVVHMREPPYTPDEVRRMISERPSRKP